MKLTDRNIVNAIAKKMQATLIERFNERWEELDAIIAGKDDKDSKLGVAIVKNFDLVGQEDLFKMAYIIDLYFNGRNIPNDLYNAVMEMLDEQ
jgi:hypothetical protein